MNELEEYLLFTNQLKRVFVNVGLEHWIVERRQIFFVSCVIYGLKHGWLIEKPIMRNMWVYELTDKGKKFFHVKEAENE
jgi:hypothetical protein